MRATTSPGFGLGLRRQHYETILQDQPALDWFEILTENYLVSGGKPLFYLDRIRASYPLAMHGVSLSIGSGDALNFDYLQQVKDLAQRIEPMWISDHLCWTGVDRLNMHDLLPIPYTEEALRHVVERVQRVQDFLGRQILLENVSSYFDYDASTMPEWEFVAAVAEQSDSLILLDINNIYVSAFNHDFDPHTYLQAMPVTRVRQFHLAGHLNLGTHIIDTHDHPVIDEVWSLYKEALRYFGPVATMIERDDRIPPLQDLLDELDIAREIARATLQQQSLQQQSLQQELPQNESLKKNTRRELVG
ncbi:MAG: DUF692 domain-containing protein [Spongiibacteraceae bacterium]